MMGIKTDLRKLHSKLETIDALLDAKKRWEQSLTRPDVVEAVAKDLYYRDCLEDGCWEEQDEKRKKSFCGKAKHLIQSAIWAARKEPTQVI